MSSYSWIVEHNIDAKLQEIVAFFVDTGWSTLLFPLAFLGHHLLFPLIVVWVCVMQTMNFHGKHVLTHCGEKQDSFILISVPCYVVLSIQLILYLVEYNDCIPNHSVLLRNWCSSFQQQFSIMQLSKKKCVYWMPWADDDSYRCVHTWEDMFTAMPCFCLGLWSDAFQCGEAFLGGATLPFKHGQRNGRKFWFSLRLAENCQEEISESPSFKQFCSFYKWE